MNGHFFANTRGGETIVVKMEISADQDRVRISVAALSDESFLMVKSTDPEVISYIGRVGRAINQENARNEAIIAKF